MIGEMNISWSKTESLCFPHHFLTEEKLIQFFCNVLFIAVLKMTVEELHQLNSQLLLQIQGKV